MDDADTQPRVPAGPGTSEAPVRQGAGRGRGGGIGGGMGGSRHLPQAGVHPAAFGGFAFESGEAAPAVAGVFVLTRRIGDLAYPAYVGEAEDMAAEIVRLHACDPALSRAVDGLYFMARPQASPRAYTVRDLVGKYDPPLNTAHRKGPAAPEIAALIPDRADPANLSAGAQLSAEIHVTEADLERLVKTFYAAARADDLIGPVFARAVSHWDEHFQVVQDFWSRSLLGTDRYNGNPYSPHIHLGLKPEYFDRWVALFNETARKVLEPNAAARAIAQVAHMSTCFQTGLFLPEVTGKAARP